MKKRYFNLALLTATSVVVAACSMQWPPIGTDRAETSEELLAAQGSWQLVEEEEPGSPINLHLNARSQVDPNKYSKVRQYAKRTPAPDENIHYRVLRLERAVSDLRGDFNRLLPPLSNLIVSDEQLDKTIKNIQVGEAKKSMASRNAMAKKPKVKPDTKMEDTKRIVSRIMPKDSSYKNLSEGPASVVGLRLGSHPGKTRIVLDLNKPATYHTDLDNGEHLLLVDLPNMAWAAQTSKSFAKHPLVKGYSVQSSITGGAVLVLELKKNTEILSSMALKPNHKYGHRLVFDLKS